MPSFNQSAADGGDFLLLHQGSEGKQSTLCSTNCWRCLKGKVWYVLDTTCSERNGRSAPLKSSGGCWVFSWSTWCSGLVLSRLHVVLISTCLCFCPHFCCSALILFWFGSGWRMCDDSATCHIRPDGVFKSINYKSCLLHIPAGHSPDLHSASSLISGSTSFKIQLQGPETCRERIRQCSVTCTFCCVLTDTVNSWDWKLTVGAFKDTLESFVALTSR